MIVNLDQLLLYSQRYRWGDLNFAEWKELILHEMRNMTTADKEFLLELLEDIEEEEKYIKELVDISRDQTVDLWKSGKKRILILRKTSQEE